MALGLFAMHVLEVMFFVGMAGSILVVFTTFISVTIKSIFTSGRT